MAPLSNASCFIPPFTVSQKAIEALEQLRDSYQGLLALEALTELDRAVLMAVEITLKQCKNAQFVA